MVGGWRLISLVAALFGDSRDFENVHSGGWQALTFVQSAKLTRSTTEVGYRRPDRLRAQQSQHLVRPEARVEARLPSCELLKKSQGMLKKSTSRSRVLFGVGLVRASL